MKAQRIGDSTSQTYREVREKNQEEPEMAEEEQVLEMICLFNQSWIM